MSPPQADGSLAKPKTKSKKVSFSAVPAASSGRNSMGQKKDKQRSLNVPKADGSAKDRGDPAFKVDKPPTKVRQRGGRGRGKRRISNQYEVDRIMLTVVSQEQTQHLQGLQAAVEGDAASQDHSSSYSPAETGEPSERRSLLTLPEEIRHQILTLVLKEPKVTEVNSVRHAPALVNACRQMHTEAVRVWLRANSFHITVDRFNPHHPVRWKEFQARHKCAAKTEMTITESHNWHNLISRCYLMRAGNDSMLRLSSTTTVNSTSYAVARAAIAIVQGMVSKPTECAAALKNFRFVLEHYDEGWV